MHFNCLIGLVECIARLKCDSLNMGNVNFEVLIFSKCIYKVNQRLILTLWLDTVVHLVLVLK